MGALVRILFPLVGYISTATIITLLAGYGYVRSSGMLDDEKMFRMVSMLHDVDLEEISEVHDTGVDEVPTEETSYQEAIEYNQVGKLLLQAKMDDLEKNLREFTDLRQEVVVRIGWYNTLKDEVDEYLRQREEKARESGITAVQKQLENLNSKKQAKPLIVEWLEEGRIDDVILLLNGMSQRSRRAIILEFNTPDEVQVLKRIYDQMLSGHPEKTFIDNKLQELEELNQQNR